MSGTFSLFFGAAYEVSRPVLLGPAVLYGFAFSALLELPEESEVVFEE